MIERLLSSRVSSVEMFEDPPLLDLFPEEEAVVARAVDKRRREFATVRMCARKALAHLGVPPAPLLPGSRGAPGWPPGIVGSMTHCTGYRAAAVARAEDLLSIGLDAEPHAPLPDGVWNAISVAAEREALPKLSAGDPGVCWDRLLFSAKESVYKAWYPLTGRWLGFDEAELTFEPGGGTFTARLLVPGPVVGGTRLGEFAGRWLVGAGLVVTAIAVPVPG